MNYHDLKNGLTVLEIEVARSGNIVKFVFDTEDVETLLANGPWYWKDSKKKSQLSLLVNRNHVPATRFIMNPSKSEGVYNVSRNPFDLRKLNLMMITKGKHQSLEFKKAAQKRIEENRESFELVNRILEAGRIISAEKEVVATKEKRQDQVCQLSPVKTKILKNIASDEIELQFEDGTRKEISIHEAQYLAKVLQRL